MNENSPLFHAVHIWLCNEIGRTPTQAWSMKILLSFTQCGEGRGDGKHLPNNILKMVGCAGVLVRGDFAFLLLSLTHDGEFVHPHTSTENLFSLKFLTTSLINFFSLIIYLHTFNLNHRLADNVLLRIHPGHENLHFFSRFSAFEFELFSSD